MLIMNNKIFVKIIAITELTIGLTTISGIMIYSAMSISQKPLNVLIYVYISSLIAILIGLGLITYRDLARRALVLFSSCIIITKIMILSNLLQFTGEIITFIPNDLKNCISFLYHGLIIMILTNKNVKRNFIKE